MEYDKVKLSFVEQQASFLAFMFDIDIDILESSKNSYHLVSYDIIDKETLLKAYNWLDTSDTDFCPIDEIDLMNITAYTTKITQKKLPIGCALRLSEKQNKQSPKYIERVVSPTLRYVKSMGHFRFYKKFCDVPEFGKSTLFIDLCPQIVVYNVGIGSKSRKGKRHNWEQRIFNRLQQIDKR
jgi:hypothetical protein